MTILNLRASAVALAVAAALASTAYAAPGSNSAYRTDAQSSHVEDATSSGIGEVNMIACIMHALSADALVNDGPYIALVDKNKCDSAKRSSTSNAGSTSEGAQAAASYITAVVNSTRASNSDPMITKAWLEIAEEDKHQTINVHISATQAPTAGNAYGVFRLDYCGQMEGMSGCPSRGYLEGTASGLNFYQLDSDGNNQETTAMRLASVSAAGGTGRLVHSGQDGDSAFVFAYDSGLFRRADDNDDQCFSRDASDPDTGMSVWRYGLYNAETGARVTRNSGFPIDVTAGGTVYHGYLGYYGLSLPPEAQSSLQNGSAVQKVDYTNGDTATRTNYTVVKSDGKLTRYTRHTRSLHSMDQIRFTTFVGFDASSFFAHAEPNSQYELYWDDARGTFVVTAQMVCGQNGCQTQELQTPEDASASYWVSRGGVQGFSQSLGGEVFINLQGASGSLDSNAIQVVYRSQDLVYPADLPAQLYCVQNCPSGASLAAYFGAGFSQGPASPYVADTYNNFQPTQANGVVAYTTDAASVTLRDGANAAVTFADAEALGQHPEYMQGVRTGRLFTRLADAECTVGSGTYCDFKVNDAEVYYQWETGSNNWNQFAAVKDANGTIVGFDAPLQLAYTVPAGTQYGQYAGKSIVLQYGGFGDLWGLPGTCVSSISNLPVNCNLQEARYVPSFAIPYDETRGRVTSTDGQTAYLAKWLDREIRFAQKPLASCTTAGLALPSNVALPSQSDLKDPTDSSSDVYIGTKPTVTAAPRVIHGDVKY
ncbi:MAG: hypothetical protein WDO56_37235 [Gammaproteobacteria bacterium]